MKSKITSSVQVENSETKALKLRYQQSHSRQAEVFIGASKTQPGETYTINDLYVRFSQGQPLPGSPGYYAEKPDFSDVDLSKLGLMDIQEQKRILDSITGRIATLKDQLDQEYVRNLEAAKAKESASNAPSGTATKETSKSS